MAVVKVYDQDKTEQGELTLTPEVFEVAVRPEILHLVVRAQLAAKRAGTHSTKTRAMVSGGGVKPWRQKGTGRARAGSNRSPVWRGGAILFGPQPRKYDFKVNKKIRKLALRMALSSRLAGDDLLVVKGFDLPEAKTKRVRQGRRQSGPFQGSHHRSRRIAQSCAFFPEPARHHPDHPGSAQCVRDPEAQAARASGRRRGTR